ncbi:MAG: NAD(P)-dependent oxidoreductase, partial [Verrucomicrobiales bacterium]|nr:NAD(P)-dependent oxidoreductase [Verrucomicrobiales bacterium]
SGGTPDRATGTGRAPLRVVVSGASGFIGRRLALRLKCEFRGIDLTCLVKSNDDAFGERGTDILISAGIDPLFTNLVTGQGLDEIGSADILFHLAANTHTWEPDQRCNDIGTERLLAAIEPFGTCSHIIFTSTVAVLDNRRNLRKPLTSESEVEARPLSRYGFSKWRAEEFLKRKAAQFGFRLTILRLSTVYGPAPRPNTFFDVLKREVSKQSLLSRLNWPGLTSFIHVDDVVDCLIAAAQNPPKVGEASQTAALAGALNP